jgi:hypothetical protein
MFFGKGFDEEEEQERERGPHCSVADNDLTLPDHSNRA